MCGRALSFWKTSLRRFIAGSMCGVKTSSLYLSGVKVAGDVHQLSFSGVGYSTPHHHTSSAEIVDLKNERTSHSGVCRHVYGHLFSAAWILIHRWTRLASSFAGPSHLLCCTIEPLQVDADVSVLRQSKDVWCVSRFHGDGFWLSVPVFVGDLGYLMMLLLLSPSGFSGEVPGCNNIELLCPYCATG